LHRLAFDTIALCAFGYRFNEFYLKDPHPFANQMAEVLIESGKRASRLSVENLLRIWSAAHNRENVAAMHKLCDELVAERKANPNPEVNDLLNTMLNSSDPVTGEKMTDESIRYNMVTFLVRRPKGHNRQVKY
jgi:cytochrome P450 / NADPH-cytochrome P450 reductase